MAATDIYLVRHGQSTWNAAGRWQGQADPPLSDHGRTQAAQLAAGFPDVPVVHLASSDLQRALDTATPLAGRFDVPLVVDPDLRELDVGSWSGLTRAEIGAADPGSLDAYFQGREGWDGGETYLEHETRARRAATRLEQVDGDGAVVAVTHGGTLRAIVLALLEIDHAHRWRFAGVGHTSLTHLRRGPHGWQLVAYSSMLELRDT